MNRNYLQLLVVALACCAPRQVAAAGHTHAHDAKGPHGGELLEMGGEEYHAELLLDEKHNIMTVYVLDGTAKKEVSVDLPCLNVNVRLNGKPVQYKLVAVQPEGQKKGPTSCFALESADLMKAVHTDAANPRLTMQIGKKAYVAKIAHNHTHAGGEETVQR